MYIKRNNLQMRRSHHLDARWGSGGKAMANAVDPVALRTVSTVDVDLT